MCGICGIFDQSDADERTRIEADVEAMCHQLRRRGPDGQGTWVDARDGIGLGHRRLSVIDLSAAGQQPMASPTGRYRIAFNGEVYNYAQIRKDLPGGGTGLKSQSDTEVLLAAIEAWGLGPALDRVEGMFAFALWDRHEKILTLARDPIGEKPIYYGLVGDRFVFGSDPSAFRPLPEFAGKVDRDSLAAFVRLGYVPSPHSIFQGIRKLEPGTLLEVRIADASFAYETKRFWSALDRIPTWRSSGDPLPDEEAADRVEAALLKSVQRCLVADVPVGVFLSGGIDSTAVASLAKSASGQTLKSFSIGFADAAFDEAPAARAVAAHLGLQHTELYVGPEQVLDAIAQLGTVYAEPFADSSQIPTLLVSKLAREQVTVCLSGDGGDELFGGYNRYVDAVRLWKRARAVPQPVRASAAWILRRVPSRWWGTLSRSRSRRVPRGNLAERVEKGSRVLESRNLTEAYQRLVSIWPDPERLVLGSREPARGAAPAASGAPEERMMLEDIASYLPDDILVKLDRASMSVGLEGRVPLLQLGVVRAAWELPLANKIRNGKGKRALRSVVARHVPAELTERPKAGFSVPLADWLRGPLREWADRLLAPERLRREGFFEAAIVERTWREHLDGSRDWHHRLWCVLMFEQWLDAQAGPADGRPDVKRGVK